MNEKKKKKLAQNCVWLEQIHYTIVCCTVCSFQAQMKISVKERQ